MLYVASTSSLVCKEKAFISSNSTRVKFVYTRRASCAEITPASICLRKEGSVFIFFCAVLKNSWLNAECFVSKVCKKIVALLSTSFLYFCIFFTKKVLFCSMVATLKPRSYWRLYTNCVTFCISFTCVIRPLFCT